MPLSAALRLGRPSYPNSQLRFGTLNLITSGVAITMAALAGRGLVKTLANGERITTLQNHFRDNPSVFAKFNPDSSFATPFVVPKDAPEQFLR